MKVASILFCVMAAAFAIGDAARSYAASQLHFFSVSDCVGQVAAMLAREAWSAGYAKALDPLFAELVRHLGTMPVSVVFAALAVSAWLLRAVWRRTRALLRGAASRSAVIEPPKTAAGAEAVQNGGAPPGNGDARKMVAPAGKGALVAAPPRSAAALPQSRLVPATSDRDFLPAALEILVTPPSPAATTLTLTICAAFAAALVWLYLDWIDIHAVALGKVQPNGRSKVVQPFEPGKIVRIGVENGATVNAGDLLLELDSTETGADRDVLTRDLEAASAEIARRRAAIEAVKARSADTPPIAFEAAAPDLVRRREESVLAADLGQLNATIAGLKAQLAEKQSTKSRLGSSITARQQLIALSKERVEMRREIETRGVGSRALVIEALQQYETHVTTDASERGQLIEIDSAMESLERRIDEVRSQFVADQTQKLAEMDRRRDRTIQELIKARSKNERTQLRAPIAGTVQQLNVTTVGQVVASGQALLTVVPLDGPIEVEAMITNRDIGFVEVGQAAVVKVEAFPFARYGTIDAKIAKVSRDAVDERSANGMTDSATATRPQGMSAPNSSQAGSLVFPATLTLARNTIRVDNKDIPLTPGMAVSVEIKTGQRRAIDYILSPLREVTSRAGTER